MNYKLSDILTGILFTGLVIGTGYAQTGLKSEPQVVMIIFGIFTWVTLSARGALNTSAPFYILLGTMIYIQLFFGVALLVNILDPGDGWVTDSTGEKHRVMQMNWIWAVLAGLILAPLAVVLYHKKVNRNRVLEIALTAAFIIATVIIFIVKELL